MSTDRQPGLLLVGATVLTPEPVPPERSAVAVLGDEIVAVGSREDAGDALPSDHRVVDLTGHCLTPGFVDTHLHPLPMAFFEHHLDVAELATVSELLDALADRARAAAPDEPVLALRVDDERLAERRLPSIAELDAVGNGRRVILLRRDGHHAVGNTVALRAAGFDRTSADPAGGRLDRDADGALTGLCAEAAASTLLSLVPTPDWDDLASATRRWAARLSAQGVTGISAICQTGDEGPAGAAGALEAIGWAGLVDTLPFDIQTVLIAEDPVVVGDLRTTALHAPDRRRRLDGIKLFLDGTFGGRTACLHQPYADRPSTSGMHTVALDEAYRRAAAAHGAGLSVCVHAIGDRANRDAAELFDRLLREQPGPHRHRVEHASLLDDETVALLAANDVTAVVQPVSIESERTWLPARLGPERLRRVYPLRSLLDAGVRVASSSDAPIETSDVLAALHAAVDRHGIAPEQAVTPLEALHTATVAPAEVRGVADTVGTIAPGRQADLVALAGDPRAGWDTVEVRATWYAGTLVAGTVGADHPPGAR